MTDWLVRAYFLSYLFWMNPKKLLIHFINSLSLNGTARFEKRKQLLKYQNYFILRDISGLYYKTITIVIDAPSVVKSDAPNCSVTY